MYVACMLMLAASESCQLLRTHFVANIYINLCVEQEQATKEKKKYLFPPNWESIIRFLILMMKALLILSGVGKYI